MVIIRLCVLMMIIRLLRVVICLFLFLRAGALTAKLKVEFHTILGCSIRF